jgi:putative tryptophan/tyrosine transport system substrate-binding protein
MYSGRPDVAGGGLMSYATDAIETYRSASSYIDRILRGAKPGELAIQV